MQADPALLGDDRAVNFPSGQYAVQDQIDALERVATKRGLSLGSIKDVPDATILRMVEGWPQASEWDRAATLGMKGDTSLDEVIEPYIDDYLGS